MEQKVLENIFQNDPLSQFFYGGCYFQDTLPKLTIGKFFLLNTSFQKSPIGEHWIGIDLRFKNKIMWLCSYNTKPRSYKLVWQRLKQLGNFTICCFPKRLQCPTVTNCGIFVAFMIYQCSRGVDIKSMMRYYFDNMNVYKATLFVTIVSRVLFRLNSSVEELLYDPIFASQQDAING